MRKHTLLIVKILVATSFFAALVYWVENQFGWAQTLAEWKNLNIGIVLFAAILVIISHILRVLRVYYAYRQTQKVTLRKVTSVSFVHNTLSYLLPMRLGEAALPALSQHQLDISLKYSSATLVLIRLFDAHMLLLLLSFFTGQIWLGHYALWLPLILILTLPIGMRLLTKVAQKVSKLEFALPLIVKTRSWAVLYGFTMGIWVTKLAGLALLVSLLGHILIDHAWIATIIAEGSAASPITGFANAGTFELAFSLPLVPLGYDIAELVKTGVNLHIFISIINIAIGIVGFALLESKNKRSVDPENSQAARS